MQTELDNLLTKVINAHQQAVMYETEDDYSDRVEGRVSTKSSRVKADALLAELREKIKEYSNIIYI